MKESEAEYFGTEIAWHLKCWLFSMDIEGLACFIKTAMCDGLGITDGFNAKTQKK